MRLHYPDQIVELHHLALSPWSRNNIEADVLVDLEKRARELNVKVSTVVRRGQGYVVRVRNAKQMYELRARGPIGELIERALDAFEAKFVYTPEELAQIQRQSV